MRERAQCGIISVPDEKLAWLPPVGPVCPVWRFAGVVLECGRDWGVAVAGLKAGWAIW